MLHQSLIDLGKQAPLSSDIPSVRGILAESQELVRNAVDHGADPQELVTWFSALVSDTLHSQGALQLTNGATIVVTGAVGRGDALPSSPIKWLAVNEAPTSTEALSEVISSVGLIPGKTPFGLESRTRDQWLETINNVERAELGVFADAGTWFLQAVIQRGDYTSLLVDALSKRPPALQTMDGLPDNNVTVDVRHDLLYPIIAIARWAGVAAQSPALSTLDRLDVASAAGILSSDQADYLKQAWDAGLNLQVRRWTDRVAAHSATAESLPAIQRGLFGASCRLVSEVSQSLANEYGITLD